MTPDKINLVIFSKDRAFQLEALLRSIFQYCHIFDEINILYTYSNNDFAKGYDILMNDLKHLNFIKWHGEKNFVEDTKRLINNEYEFTCLLVDDCIFYDYIYLWREEPMSITRSFDNENFFKKEIINAIIENASSCFSFRLGKNIKIGNYSKIECTTDDFINVDWNKSTVHFAYPFSTDGHIFWTRMLASNVNAINFSNPNGFEANLQGRLKFIPNNLLMPEKSIVVSMPLNIVSKTTSCAHGEKHPYSTEELNRRFLNGELMNFKHMKFGEITNVHKEVELKFMQRNRYY